MKKIALNLLAWLASLVARKFQVKIVAVTGSVGKTTAKEVIYAVLKQAYNVERSLYNANTEWGICASVIAPGFEPSFTSEGKARISLMQYLGLIWQAKKKLIFGGRYPQVLVLELAADRPGDIHWFNRWFEYDVAVITVIGSTHLDYFKDQAELTAEKLSLIEQVKARGLVVINAECAECDKFVPNSTQRVVRFGWERGEYQPELVDGQTYRLRGLDSQIEVTLPVGRQFVPAALMGYAVGQEFGLTDEQIQQGLSGLQPVGGRFEVIKTDRWTIINDAYNAAPESMKSALASLKDLASGRKIAILGEMRELGDKKIPAHHAIGAEVLDCDELIVMGSGGGLIADGAVLAGMAETKIVRIDWSGKDGDVKLAMEKILPRLQDGDTVLVKASRTIYLDRLVQALVQHSR